MQVRAALHGLGIGEFDVPYRRRSAGVSKISRTVSGTVKAGRTILWVIARELVRGYSIGVKVKASPAGGG